MLIVLNALAWMFVQRFGTEPGLGASVCALGLVPGQLLQTLAAGTRREMGPGVYCVLSASPNWLTPLTHMFQPRGRRAQGRARLRGGGLVRVGPRAAACAGDGDGGGARREPGLEAGHPSDAAR